MQIVSLGDNLHEMSEPIFWKKQEKYHKSVVFQIIQSFGKG